MKTLLLFGALLIFMPQSGNGVVSGRLQLRDGNPAAGIAITALDAADSRVKPAIAQRTVTEADGRYHLTNLGPGRYFIAAGPLGTLSYYPGVPSLKDAAVVTVSRAAPVGNIDFTFLPVKVAGRVILPDKEAPRPVDGIRVEIPGDEDSSSQEVFCKEDGTFQFSQVLPGAHVARVNWPSRSVTFKVSDQDISELVILLLPAGPAEIALKETLESIRTAIRQHRTDRKKGPRTLGDLVAAGYLTAIPEDPIEQSSETWQIILGIDGLDLTDTGILDVHSGSIKMSPIAGVPYNTW